jgi:hypothetical protein
MIKAPMIREIMTAKVVATVCYLQAALALAGWCHSAYGEDVLLDKQFSPADLTKDFAGRGRLSIPLGSGTDATHFFRLSIESRDTSRSPVYLSIRGKNRPPRTYWSATLNPNETLSENTYVIQVDAPSDSISLTILTGQPQSLELPRVKLTRESRDDLIAAIKRDRQDLAISAGDPERLGHRSRSYRRTDAA